MQFVLGPAGGGKTFRCLAQMRQILADAPEGLPLVLVTPKQTTYQIERQLLAYPSVQGYTRLHVLSFERLANFVFARLRKPAPEMLEEEGRLMVLRGLLAKKRDNLKLFRASARLTGFAQQLSQVLRELQRSQLTPESLLELSQQVEGVEGLSYKLQDLSVLLREYLDWLKAHRLQDEECLLGAAVEALSPDGAVGESGTAGRKSLHESSITDFRLEHLWCDGFADWSGQELDLLAALVPHCQGMTLTFCLDRVPAKKISWLSNWSVSRKSFEECQRRLGNLPEVDLAVEILGRFPNKSRFLNNPVLQHLEGSWEEPRPYIENSIPNIQPPMEGLSASLRVAICSNPEAEATEAAREVIRHVRAGGRYRDVTVLVRKLEGYHQPLQRIFSRYEIPFFMDRRESVSHHPMAELTRSALRTVARQWTSDDWFAALKTGLVPAQEKDIDELENEALARGWKGKMWHQPIRISDLPKSVADQARIQQLQNRLESLRQRVVAPFLKLALALATQQNKPTGTQLAAALRDFWKILGVEERLQIWADSEVTRDAMATLSSVHRTVWEQMNGWLENLELGFRDEAIPLREWLPILEAGLGNLSVGVIPPALDQVLIGAIDRSRNPDIKLALVLGMNETVFPAPPQRTVLLSELDRAELEKRNVVLTANMREQIGRERYHAYIACTRARARVVLASSLQDAEGSPLNPSPFLAHVRQLFPTLKFEVVSKVMDWRESEHHNELVGPMLKLVGLESKFNDLQNISLAMLRAVPALEAVMARLRQFDTVAPIEAVTPELAARLYGPVLRTSVSRMEQFAACPFKFFVQSGLRAEERKMFELDVKEQGSFQHDVLAYFHEELRKENKRWRDITPEEARRRIGKVAQGLMASYHDGLLELSEQTRFMARVLTESLQDFVEVLVGWMGQQYRFDPVRVELPFGEDAASPAWKIPVGQARIPGETPESDPTELVLALYGRIDRIDICRDEKSGIAHCVVVDYKSSQKHIDDVLMEHGLQLQLLTYLNVLRKWPNPGELFGAKRLVPAGVFYVNLRGKYEREQNRTAALADTEDTRRLAYRHSGRFDTRALPLLDGRQGVQQGDQFNYNITKSGKVHGNCREAMATAEFVALLDLVETNLKRMGQEIFSGLATVSPYRKGSQTACDQCDYRAICRIDPWTHSYRALRKKEAL
jgi:ATP-dependent helicase/nuclease subunit B